MTEGHLYPPAEEPVDTAMLAESKVLGVPFQAFRAMSPKERTLVRARFVNSLKAEARRRGLEPDVFVKLSEGERDVLRARHPAQKRVPRSLRAASAEARAAEIVDDEAPDGTDDAPTEDPEAPEAPPDEQNPRRRETMSLGEVYSKDEDLVGEGAPTHFEELLTRWTPESGHFLRVERTQPKFFQNIACAGMVGKITAPMSEEEFQAVFGGREYKVTVFGPDPKGRHDPHTGRPRIKQKTEAITVFVPGLDPNLSALPGAQLLSPEEDVMTSPAQNPISFQSFFGGGNGRVPHTPADAQMHKSGLDFITAMVKDRDESARVARKAEAQTEQTMLQQLGESHRQAMETAREESKRREDMLLEQLKEHRTTVTKLQEDLRKLTEAPQGTLARDVVDMAQKLNPNVNELLKAEAERHKADIDRMKEQHAGAMEALKQTHEVSMGALRAQMESDRRNEKDRFTDQETHWKRKLQDERDDFIRRDKDLRDLSDRREKELKEEIARVKEEARKDIERAVAEERSRTEMRLSDMKTAHEREIRAVKENGEMKLTTEKTLVEMRLNSATERVTQLQEELEETKREAAENADPVKMLEKAREQAEQLGYTKADEGKQTAMQRFAGTAGMGFSKMLEEAPTWVPKVFEQFRAAQAQAQAALPQQQAIARAQLQQQQHAAAAAAANRPKAVTWAAKHATPVAGPGPGPAPPAPPPPPAPPRSPHQVEPLPQRPAQPPQTIPADPQPVAVAPPEPAPPAPAASAMGIDPALVAQFRADIELAIENGIPAEDWAKLAYAQAGPQLKQVALMASPDEVLATLERMPNTAGSPILRREGRKWLHDVWNALRAMP